MRRSIASHVPGVTLLGVLLSGVTGVAMADDELQPGHTQSSREILEAIDLPRNGDQTNWFGQAVRVNKKHGLEINRMLDIGGRDMTLSLQGPVMKKKNVGLGFEIRF